MPDVIEQLLVNGLDLIAVLKQAEQVALYFPPRDSLLTPPRGRL